jgi:lysyl-tRNA synthetase, class II
MSTGAPSGPGQQLELQRREKRAAAGALGLDVYGGRTPGLTSLAGAGAQYDASADAEHKERGKEPGFADRRPVVKVAGRVVLHRDNGKLIWMNLRDASGDLQVAVSQRDCAAPGFDLAKLTDLGDLLVVKGPLVKTKTGETTVWASEVIPAAKCLLTPPEKHAGLSDVELRYRQRYVDLWANPETIKVFQARSAIVSCMRREMDRRGYMEVETPMLQTLAGGAAARPFVAHMNALDIDLFLRIAPELYLKRLLVGGLPRVYEINRNFRNEGLDKQHNPEFTMLEAYDAYGDVSTVMDLTEGLIRAAAEAVASRESPDVNHPGGRQGLTLPFGETMVDYGSPFAKVAYGELFERALGFSMQDAGRVRDEAQKRGIISAEALKKMDDALVVNEVFEACAEKSLDPDKPTFITDYPSAISPLTRPRRDDPTVAERADLFIGHMEIGPHYTELNDPDVQETKFREQLRGLDDEEATFRTFDADFIRALKVGMPPAGGMGIGIDRVAMLLTNQRTIRDVVLFPMMRPE